MAARIDDPALDVTADSVLVLKNAGPLGAPGDAGVGPTADSEEDPRPGRQGHAAHLRRAHEWNQLRRVRAARRAGIVRGRTPGVCSGTGDLIELDVAQTPPGAQGQRRRARPPPRRLGKMPPPRFERGYGALYQQHITQATRDAISIFSKAPRRPQIRRFTDREDRRPIETRRRSLPRSCKRAAAMHTRRRWSRVGSSTRTSWATIHTE